MCSQRLESARGARTVDALPLRRHRLVHLTAPGWRELLGRAWTPTGLECLRHWASRELPLVVTAQPPAAPERACPPVQLGLAAPLCWERQLLRLPVAPEHIAWLTEFPTLTQAVVELPRPAQAPLLALARALRERGVTAQAYGSVGWQHLSRLRYLHDRSDLDLWMAVDDSAQADAAAQALQHCRVALRLDGELLFPDGAAVSWREWLSWRRGECRQILVKRLRGAALETLPVEPLASWSRAA